MQDNFKVQESDAIRVSSQDLKHITRELFQKAGVPLEDAVIAAEVIVMAD